MQRNRRIFVLSLLILCLDLNRLSATEVVFNIDSSQSFITSVTTVLGMSLVPQAPGSLTANYEGTITVELDTLDSPTSIEFLSANAVAMDTGNYLPQRGGGSLGDPGVAEAGNYGGEVDLFLGYGYVSVRDFAFGLTSNPVPITNGEFASDSLTIDITSAVADYNTSSLLANDFGSESLVSTQPNMSTDPGHYDMVDGVATLTVPLLWEQGDPRLTNSSVGVLVATATILSACDFDRSGICDIVDLDTLVAEVAQGGTNLQFDLDGDGLIGLGDVESWRHSAGAENLGPGIAYLPGDANLDGNVDGQDFVSWNTHKFVATAKWSQGDWNADGMTDGQDFVIWNNNKFTTSADVTTVPESSAVHATLFLFLMIIARTVTNVGRS